jgi:glyoxylase-like metal-dependent hydrolase (beta-lactamase superfamily II)
VKKDENILIRQIKVGLMENFSYLVGSKKTGEAVVVDPGWDADKILKKAKLSSSKIVAVLLTHSHYDHTNALPKMVHETQVKVYVHGSEEGTLDVPASSVVRTRDGEELELAGLKFKVIHTPGHTSGSQCFQVDGYLITGDTLFAGAVGRVDLATGSRDQMLASMERLKELPDDVIVLPGHDYGPEPVTTIGKEKKKNPFMRDEDAFET